MANIERKLVVSSRKEEGKGASRRLRHSGHVPAIVYGGNQEPQSIKIEHNHLWHTAQNEWFYSSILSLEVDGKAQRVLLRDMQRHPFKQQIMHLDFQRISENETLRARVPLHFLNGEKSPAGKTAGVVVMHELVEVEVSALPKDLPAYIEVGLSELTLGDVIHMSDLKLRAGVRIQSLTHGKEHDVAVVTAKHARVEEEPAAEEEASAEAPAAKVAATPEGEGGDAKKK